MNSFFNHRISLFAFVFFLFFTSELTAQRSTSSDSIAPKQEVKLDIFQLIVLPGIEVVYERFIDDYSSWGIMGLSTLTSMPPKPIVSKTLRFLHFTVSTSAGKRRKTWAFLYSPLSV